MLRTIARKFLPRQVQTAPGSAHVWPNAAGSAESHSVENADGSADALLPSKDLQDYVGGNYVEVGEEFLVYLRELCHLQPDEKVLDVGSGSGRIAVPLTGYLNSAGLYHGFDVAASAVAWCQENITRRFPNFKFQVADVYNGSYMPQGKGKPTKFRFPYLDETFDVVFLASVFTHMLPTDVEHYLAEIGRVLKPAGRVMITFFLLNDESISLIDAQKGVYNFEHQGKGYRTINKSRPEDAMAYPETFIRSLYQKSGLKMDEPIRYGSWCGRETYLSFQDIVIATRTDSALNAGAERWPTLLLKKAFRIKS